MTQTTPLKSARRSTLGTAAAKRGPPSRGHDPEGTKRDILEVATEEFARDGLAGARIDEIAAKTSTSKRMIYYYFGSKEGLYQAVLEQEYGRIRALESTLELDLLPPLEALRKLVGFTFDFTHHNETFVRLVMIENIHQAQFLSHLSTLQHLSASNLEGVRRLYQRGLAEGVFREGLDPLGIHWQISALCFFSVANRPTFSTLFKVDPLDAGVYASRRQSVLEMVERYVCHCMFPSKARCPRDAGATRRSTL